MPDRYESLARRRMHPKLRVLANSDARVNAAKAEVQGFLKVTPALAAQAPRLGTAVAPGQISKRKTAVKDLNTADRRENVEVNVFVRSTAPVTLGPHDRAQGRLASMRLGLEEIENLAGDANIVMIEPAETLKPPRPLKGSATTSSPTARVVGNERKRHGHGAGVIIGLIDVEGFDWAHLDFLDQAGKSRFVSIWDQGAKDGTRPTGFDYGRVISPADMAQAVAEAKQVHVSPHDLEPQSQMAVGSHGTHVASIAAGASGVCSKADIAAVLISLPDEDLERRTSFYDSTRLLDAVIYLLDLAGGRPISINISLGTNGHAHDGSSAVDRWLDVLLAEPGRSICIAAGNAGQERPEAPDDLGYMLGRIHAGSRIAAQGLDHDLEWEVVGDRIKDASENEMELWYEPQDRFAISIRPPDGQWIGPIAPGEFLENFQLADRTMLSIYNELHHPANGANYIAVYLSPFLGDVVVGVKAGTWLVKLHGLVVRDGRFHAWIERDDPVDIGDGTHYWPSFFSARSNVDASSVSALACGQRVVSVANFDEARRSAHITSSQGPTRDARPKPDIAAPGTDIVAANGFGDPTEPWIPMTGTSMASPYVAGVIGLMLAVEKTLTAAQILGILKATAQPLPGSTFEWVNDCGFGVITPEACLREAGQVTARLDAKVRFKGRVS
jgi:subtilisin family serine protease